jgi:putative tricarboxylic transport membrane protein
MVLGLQPGPLLFSDSPDVIYTVFASTITSNVFMIILGIVGARFFAKVLSLPKSVIVAFIFVFSVLGAYSMRNSMFDIVVMMTAGLLGYIFSILDYPVPPVLLGVILGPLVESNLGRTLLVSDGNLLIFFKRPISIFFILIIVGTIGSNIYKHYKSKRTA